tara:strand:- start:5 stop:409 length:405 start_codon:yes stop_codon:yes gene_type:complete
VPPEVKFGRYALAQSQDSLARNRRETFEDSSLQASGVANKLAAKLNGFTLVIKGDAANIVLQSERTDRSSFIDINRTSNNSQLRADLGDILRQRTFKASVSERGDRNRRSALFHEIFLSGGTNLATVVDSGLSN